MLVICILNAINSILFCNELSLVMKNGLFTITSFGNHHGPSVMNHHKQHQNPCGKSSWCWPAPDQTVSFSVLALTIRPGLGWPATSHKLLNLKPVAGQTLNSG